MKFEVQTRAANGSLRYFDTINEAFDWSEIDSTVWKISFPLPTGERVRLVKNYEREQWVYEDIMKEVDKYDNRKK